VVVGERGGRLARLGGTVVGAAARPLDVVRWFDDLLAVAPIKKPGSVTRIPNDDAGPLRLVDLADPAGPRDAGTFDLPGDTVDLFPLGHGRLVGVGRPAELPSGDLSVEVSTLDLRNPAAPRQVDRVSWGHGEQYRSAVLTIGGRTLVLTNAWVDADGPCPDGVRCVNRPRPKCVPADKCPADNEIGGLIVTGVGKSGRLSRAGWLPGVSGEVLLVGKRIAVVSGDAMTLLDPRTLQVVGAIRQAKGTR
jgi:hypothetical protein